MKKSLPHLAIFTVLLICFLAVVPPAVHGAAENLQGAVVFVFAQPNTGNNYPGIGWQAVDFANTSRQPTVRVCIDDATINCPSNNYKDIPSNCPSFVATGGATCVAGQTHGSWRPASDGNLGSVNPVDGTQHHVYLWVRSQDNPGVADVAMDNWPTIFTYTWDLVNNTFLAYDIPVTTSATPITPASMVVLVNRSDPYSIGSSGTIYCTVNGTDNIREDGVAGYLGFLHSIPCDTDHFKVASMTVASTISVADFNTAWNGLIGTGHLTAGIQYASAGWMQPHVVTGGTNAGPGSFANCQPQGTKQACYAMSAWIMRYPTTNGVEPTYTNCTSKAFGVGKGPDNPNYNSGTNSTPRTSYGVMPTMMLAAATCTSGCTATNGTGTWTANFLKWKAVADAGFAAIATNPTGGNAQVTITTANPYSENLAMPPALLGTAISSAWNYVRLGTASSPVVPDVTTGLTANAIYYHEGAQNWRFNSPSNILNAIPGAGVASALGSVTGFLSGGQSQTPDVAWLATTTGGATGVPFIAVASTAVEPCEAVALKHHRSQIFGAEYVAGNSVLAALAKSDPEGWISQFTGYPFAQPFSPPLPTVHPTWFMVHGVFPMIGIACFAFLGFVRRMA